VPPRYRLHRLAPVLVVYLFWLLSDLLISIVFAIGDEGIDASHGRDAPVIGLMEPSTEDNKSTYKLSRTCKFTRRLSFSIR
jgi:hypothetical protein